MRCLAITLSILFTGPALAATGECAFEHPDLMAPWTDGDDPACGDDCVVPKTDSEASRCEDEEAGCTIEDRPLLDLRMPKPEGPRCLEPSPWCTTNTGPALASGKTLVVPPPLPRPRGIVARRVDGLRRPASLHDYEGLFSQFVTTPVSPPPRLG